MIRNVKRVFLLLLICFSNTGTFAQKTSKVIDSLLTVLKTAKEDTNKIKSLNILSRQYINTGQYDEGMKYANEALSLANKILNAEGKGKNVIQVTVKREIANSYHHIAFLHYKKSNYPGALKNNNIALKIREEIGDKKGIAYSYGNIGHIFVGQGDYPRGLKNYLATLKYLEEIGDKKGIANTYGNIGNIYHHQSNYPEALKYYLASLKIREEIRDKEGIAILQHNISDIFSVQRNYTEALKSQLASLKILEEVGDKDGIAAAYNGIGNIYYYQSNYPEALKNYLVSLKIKEVIGDKGGIAISYNNIGKIFSKQGNYQEALKNFLASLKLLEEIGDKKDIAVLYNNIGVLLSDKVSDKNTQADTLNYNEALQYLNKGMLLAKEIGANECIKDSYKALSVVYKRMNNYKKALEYNNLYIMMNDSLMNNETTLKLEQLRTQHEVERAVTEEKMQQEKVLAEKNAKHELELAEEKLIKEKAIEVEKLKYEFALAEEKTKEERILAEQKFQSEKTLAIENARHQQAISEQKDQQEREKAAIKRRNEFLMMGAGMLIVILVLGSLYLRQKTLKQKAMERVETVHKMAELELQSLRAQLNPHFMFNSLNAIQDLILKEDNRSSHRYLSRFSKLLRMLLDNANQPFIPLKKELDFLELYLSLENLRIPDLQHSIKIEPGIDAESTMIPNMMMQPYIENAIWHGLSHKTSDKKLGVNIHKENGSVQFDIEDNGVGRKKSEELKSLYRKEHKSKGMELLSKRFNLLSKEYGTVILTHVTDLMDNGEAAGTLVEISVPLSFAKKAKEVLYDTNHYN